MGYAAVQLDQEHESMNPHSAKPLKQMGDINVKRKLQVSHFFVFENLLG